MDNKQLKKAITWRKLFYKRILCKHTYKGYNFSNLFLNGEYHTDICTKCGKIKYKPVFWEYEGIGFK